MTSSESRSRLGRRSLLGLLTAVPAAAAGGAWALTGSPAATATGAAPAHPAPVPPDLRPGGTFDRFLSQLARQDDFSGTVLVVRDDHQVLSRSYGMADTTKAVPNGADTIYCLASVTKLFTATAIGQLVQRGALSLLDTVGRHLTGFPAGIADNVTIHHLLTHTSGMGDFTRYPGYFSTSATWTTAEQVMDGTLDIVRQQPLAFPPGAGSLYSNSGYHVLGAVTAKVAGTSYYDYVRAHLFRPAGMADSDFYTRPQWQAGRRFAHPYATDPSSGIRSDVVDQTVFIGNPAGNAFATAPDLVRFARALLGGTLLDAPYREVFLSPKAPLPPKAEEPAAVPFGTYSATAALINGSWVVGHNGAAPGSSTNLDWYPGGGWVAVKLSNYDVPTTQAVDLRLHEILTR